MKWCKYFFHFVSICLISFAGITQVKFRTIVPGHSILVNESFQVQYVVEAAKGISNFAPPSFTGFRIAAGPNAYTDNQSNRTNWVVTLVALHPGRMKIPGATCALDGRVIRSDDIFVRILSSEQSAGAYVLARGEDPYNKIRRNLFLKLVVDKESCFIGEPLVATFKLYSRLQSKSNVIKNPGFYGFSVYDMVEVNDKVQTEERVNGEWFEVHTIRKVQLYPLEPGRFTIDPMELANEVEFSRNAAGKGTRQQVTENMYNDSASVSKSDTENYSMSISSQPVVITVKPFPGRDPADTFAGAVGNFSITAFLQKDSVLKNEEDSLMVEINGAGNFQRVNAPMVTWPDNFETFEPSVKDSLDKSKVPLAGSRRFKYVFVSNSPGFHTIPSISFSFFEIKKQAYQTVSTKPFTLFISAKSRTDKPVASPALTTSADRYPGWILVGAGLLIATAAFVLWAVRRRGKTSHERFEQRAMQALSVQELLRPAAKHLGDHEKIFYETLDRCIWNYFSDRLGNFSMHMIKIDLLHLLVSRGVGRDSANEVLALIHQCETGVYTNAQMDYNKEELLQGAEKMLVAIEKQLRPGEQ